MSKHYRFFIDQNQINGGIVTIAEHHLHQITNVLRLTINDKITLLDGTGNELLCEICEFSKKQVVAKIISIQKCLKEPDIKLTIALCLPKSDKVDLIIQKCTELGVSEFILLDSNRVISKPEKSKTPKKIARWTKIAAESSEQCGRAIIPKIQGIIQFSDFINSLRDNNEYDLEMIAWEEESGHLLNQVICENQQASSILLIIGPEGGFCDDEVELAISTGIKPISLGKRILRAETAAIASCSVIMALLER